MLLIVVVVIATILIIIVSDVDLRMRGWTAPVSGIRGEGLFAVVVIGFFLFVVVYAKAKGLPL